MSTERHWRDYVKEDGTLGGKRVLQRETLYESLNGTKVERFNDGVRSFIYKPIGSAQLNGREKWAHDTIIPLLANIRVPRILAAPEPGKQTVYWLIYEDFGRLRHCTEPAHLIEAAGWIPEWHQLTAALVPETYAGHTPKIGEVLKPVMDNADRLHEWIYGCDAGTIAAWKNELPAFGERMETETPVVSHGDYHPYNVAIQSGERIVIDWEYVHLNHRYWDIYSLLDITSFRYSKVSLTPGERAAALRRYWQRSEREHAAESFEQFNREYQMYAAVYSAWIAGLIEGDLRRGDISREKLMKQRQETSAVFTDCMRALGLM